MMKIPGERTLGDIIREMVDTYRLEGKLNEVKLLHSWPEIAGEMITRHTKDLYIRNGKLFVKIDSPALRNELTYSRTEILEKLNRVAGAKVINEVIFTE